MGGANDANHVLYQYLMGQNLLNSNSTLWHSVTYEAGETRWLAADGGSKVRSLGQWLAANCGALPTANAGQYATLHCKPLLFWFPCSKWRFINVRRTFNLYERYKVQTAACSLLCCFIHDSYRPTSYPHSGVISSHLGHQS